MGGLLKLHCNSEMEKHRMEAFQDLQVKAEPSPQQKPLGLDGAGLLGDHVFTDWLPLVARQLKYRPPGE